MPTMFSQEAFKATCTRERTIYLSNYYTRTTYLTSVLVGKDPILSGWWSKIEVTQVLGSYDMI